MKNVLIIGATGTLGSATRQAILDGTDDKLTLFARSTNRIRIVDDNREKVISGNVMNDADRERDE